jgi:hypothetical protein
MAVTIQYVGYTAGSGSNEQPPPDFSTGWINAYQRTGPGAAPYATITKVFTANNPFPGSWSGSNAAKVVASNGGVHLLPLIVFGGTGVLTPPSVSAFQTFIASAPAGQKIAFQYINEPESGSDIAGAAYKTNWATCSANLNTALQNLGGAPFYTRANFPMIMSSLMSHYSAGIKTDYLPAPATVDAYGADFYQHVGTGSTQNLGAQSDPRYQNWLASVQQVTGTINNTLAFPEYGIGFKNGYNATDEAARAALLLKDFNYIVGNSGTPPSGNKPFLAWNYWYQWNSTAGNDWTFPATSTTETAAQASAVTTNWQKVIAFASGTPSPSSDSGTAAVLFPKPRVSALGTEGIPGTAAVRFPKPSAAAHGLTLDSGAGGTVLPKSSVSATGLIIGSGAFIPKPSVSGTGSVVNPGTVSARFPKPVVSAAGAPVIPGAILGDASVLFPKPSAAAAGLGINPGAAAIIVPKPGTSGSGTFALFATAAVLVPKPFPAAQGIEIVSGTVAVASDKPSVSAQGGTIVQASASSVSAVTSSASVFFIVPATARSRSVTTSRASGFSVVLAGPAASVSSVITRASALILVQARALSSSIVMSSARAATLFGKPPLPTPPRVQPAWQRDVQRFAISEERRRHVQALWQFGELAVFCLMWTAADNAAGLVGRCQRCFASPAAGLSTEDRISASYGQGNQYACTDCFGTQFEGGYRALIVRPAIFNDMDKGQTKSSKGVVQPGTLGIETTPDFRVRPGDYCFRSDGDRFQLRRPKRTTLRTGFATPWQQDAAIDYNQLNAALEDPASVAYKIPPAAAELAQVLGTYTRVPADFSWFEVIRAPLIPSESPPPAAGDRLQPVTTFPLS